MNAGLDARRVRAVLFDVDGTLADTDDDLTTRLARVLQPVAGLLPQSDARSFARRIVLMAEAPGNALFALADRLGLDDLAAPALDVLHWARGESRPSHFTIIPGVADGLHRLRPRYALAVVTARDRRSTHAFLGQFGLGSLFACVATARTCRRTKPDPAPVLWAAACLGVPPQACLMVGDTTVDIRAGKAAGTQTLGVLSGFGERLELERAGADLILDTSADLPGVLFV